MLKSKIPLQLRNKVVYIAALILFFRLIEVHYIYIIPFIFILYFVIRRFQFLLIYTGCIITFILFSLSVIVIKSTPVDTVYVKGDIKYGDITSFTGSRYGKYYKMYTDQNVSIRPGDKITFSGVQQEVEHHTIPYTFDYKKYLLSKRINTTIFADDIEVIGHRFSLQSYRMRISSYIEQSAPISGHYIKTFILADQSGFDDDIKEDINILGVSHLFAVSGLHIGMLSLILDRTIKRYLPKVTPQKIIIPVLILYLIITSFSPSVIRASLLYIGLYVNKKKNLDFTTLDILSFIFIGYLIVSPYAIYALGFSLSFLVTYSILLGHYMLKNQSNSKQLIVISILAIAVALPITTAINYEVNLISIIVNVVLIYGMSFVILPLGYITFLLPFFDRIYGYFIVLYEKLIVVFSNITLFRIHFNFISHIQILLYYVLLLLLLANIYTKKRTRYVIVMSLFLVISMNFQKLNPVKSMTMIDVYGDSIFIKDAFNRCNILIDTGVPDDYNAVVSYLKGKGINRIDYFIVTHEDSDHKGEREDIHYNFDVRREINSRSEIDSNISCGSIYLSFLTFYDSYMSENNQSIVFVMDFANQRYLFTGDMEYRKEEEFARLYDIDVDVLKSGHHGSITSSSDIFLDDIKAEEVWISCYRKNTHNHPHDIVISRYEDRKMDILRTDLYGTIEEYFIFGKGYKKYHKP